MTQEQIKARHEAAHIVVGALLGMVCHQATLTCFGVGSMTAEGGAEMGDRTLLPFTTLMAVDGAGYVSDVKCDTPHDLALAHAGGDLLNVEQLYPKDPKLKATKSCSNSNFFLGLGVGLAMPLVYDDANWKAIEVLAEFMLAEHRLGKVTIPKTDLYAQIQGLINIDQRCLA
ncbi:MAG: hypothetical protein JSS72_00965 [Armatimonadetes bacterium]|nr:hypothetical protein [Armatimonadota bacterium]